MKALLPLLLALCASCQSVASVTSLPPELAEQIGYDASNLDALRRPSDELEVTPQIVDDVRGGQIAFALSGTPAEVSEMLLDFEGANEARLTWCDRYEALDRDENNARAVWHFKRYKLIKPVVTLNYAIEPGEGDSIALRFRAEKPVMGVAALFGDYRLHPLPTEDPETLAVVRVFADTGLPIQFDPEDLAQGMRDDAAALRIWIEQRIAR